jgi:RNA polymerase sigma factor (sigma-70 family)
VQQILVTEVRRKELGEHGVLEATPMRSRTRSHRSHVPAWSELGKEERPIWFDGLHERNEESWVELVKRFQPVIRYRCMRLELQDADAADIAQQVFLRLILFFEEPRPDLVLRDLTRLIMRMIRNEAIDLRRKRERESGGVSAEEAKQALGQAIGREERPAVWERLWVWDLVESAFRRLRPSFRKDGWRLLLGYAEGRPYHQIADELGVSEGAVTTRLHRLLRAMRQEIKSMDADYE